jgi:hypothetical protein
MDLSGKREDLECPLFMRAMCLDVDGASCLRWSTMS